MSLLPQSPEQRTAALAKARTASVQKQASRRQSSLRRAFLDMPYWEALARKRGVRLPLWGEPPQAKPMRSFLTRCRRTVTWYYADTGEKSLDEFALRNPDWPLRAWAGIVLELLAREEHVTVRVGGELV